MQALFRDVQLGQSQGQRALQTRGTNDVPLHFPRGRHARSAFGKWASELRLRATQGNVTEQRVQDTFALAVPFSDEQAQGPSERRFRTRRVTPSKQHPPNALQAHALWIQASVLARKQQGFERGRGRPVKITRTTKRIGQIAQANATTFAIE